MDNRSIVNFILKRAQSFLSEEVFLEPLSTEITCNETNILNLKSITAIQGINSSIGLFVAMSFDAPIIEKICDIMTEGLDIPEEEKDVYVEGTAGEILNIIVGNATSDFQIKGNAIKVSPPIVIKDAKNIIRHRDAYFYTATISTDIGEINLYIVGPKNIFDQKLNYMEEQL